ncbi:MAG: hydroxymethylglutaryl-CoA lyase [Ginsengibacter sp.]
MPVKLIECPRDAMQGWPEWIDTSTKINYINSLLQVGFDTIDFGSFVSAKAIPQMKDTKEVLEGIDLSNSKSKLLAIIANVRGAEEAVCCSGINYLGFPFSISETFQKRNTNKTIIEAFDIVQTLRDVCIKHSKELVIYLSMGFGNPYGDEFNEEIVLQWVEKLYSIGIKIISLSDTVGVATPDQIQSVLKYLIPKYNDIEIGVHLHSSVADQERKILAAYNSGCRRFDGALKGIGGCPMANDELIGNINMEQMVNSFEMNGIETGINQSLLLNSLKKASTIFHN